MILFAAVNATALNFTLDRKSVKTSIEGTKVELLVSGPVDIEFANGNADIRIDATVELGDLQKHFAAIALARATNEPCGDSVTLDGATLKPKREGTEWLAEVAGNATITSASCDAKHAVTKKTTTSGALVTLMKPRSGAGEHLAFDVTVAAGSDPKVAVLLANDATRAALTAMLTGSLSSAVGGGAVATLSPEAASYDPRVKSVAFQTTTDGALAAHLVVTFTVPLAKLGEWHVGK
jgi:hypothetical protein